MPDSALPDYRTREYWNARVKGAKNEKDMIFLDPRREEFWRRVEVQLALWKDLKVLDIACGFGRFAGGFNPEKYVGMDFSDEMYHLAKEKFPRHRFEHWDAGAGMLTLLCPFDIIFEVNSLKSLGMTAEDFISKYKPYARVAVACLEADRFTVENLYPSSRAVA